MTTATAIDYSRPHDVSDVLMAFPGVLGSDLLPPMSAIPEDYEGRRAWESWQSDWFFSRLKTLPEPKDGIDGVKAMRHLHTIQGSFQPKHEHKQAAVAWLASLWLKKPV